jgi:glycine/D-amino acid oxidase-like deaminating enzyme
LSNAETHVAIVGAGIVGVSCALWLQKKGFKVSLIDGNEPGSITSSGNACTIANYGCVPVNNSSLIRRLPQLMFSKDSPLTINPWYAATHLPWMLSFLKHCSPGKVQKTIDSLGSILKHTNDGLDPLIELSNSEDLFIRNGCMYVYESQQGFDNARASNQARADQGSEFNELSKDDIYSLEPHLAPRFEKGILFEDARHVLNPKSLVDRYFKTFIDSGGLYIDSHATGITHNEKGLKIFLKNSEFLRANKIVVCCGAFSRQLEGCDSEKLPLETERGYNIQYADQQSLVNRPVAWAESGFYATPMNEGLRFAGTVEIAGLSPKKNPQNVNYLTTKSKQMFDLPMTPSSDWLGYRPTFPDSLPVIGASEQSPNTYYAFGHQHIGLTLAGITGKLISEIIENTPTSLDITPFSPKRFTTRRVQIF